MNHFFKIKDALPLVGLYFNSWSNKVDHQWFELAFQALEKSGLTCYENKVEGRQVRERIVFLALIYKEFTNRSAFHESSDFHYWSEETILRFKTECTPYDENDFNEIIAALNKYFGSETEVIIELWINCEEGHRNRQLPLAQKLVFYQKMRSEMYDDFNFFNALRWYKSIDSELDDFECISI
jgi:hypothetical protein